MLAEMTRFVDLYAQKRLGKDYSPDWPRHHLIEVFKAVLMESQENSKKRGEYSYILLFYDLENRKFKEIEYPKQKHEIKVSPLAEQFLENPQVSQNIFGSGKSASNKRIGSTKGIQSFFPFIFKIELDKDYNKRLQATREALLKRKFNYFAELYSEEFIDSLIAEINKLKSKALQSENKKDIFVFINIPEKKIEEYISDPTFYNNSISQERSGEGTCQICGTRSVVGYPLIGNAFASEKSYLSSPTKGGRRIEVCGQCGIKLIIFNFLLKNRGDLLPVFIHPQATKISVENIDTLGLEYYYETMDRIHKLISENQAAHYLVIRTKDGYWIDYIANFKWRIDNWTRLDWKRPSQQSISLNFDGQDSENLHSILSSILDGKRVALSYINEPEVENPILNYLVYRYNFQIYRLIYHTDLSALNFHEYLEIVNKSIESYVYKSKKGSNKLNNFIENIEKKRVLELFFNVSSLINSNGEERGVIMRLSELRDKFKLVMEKKSSDVSDAEWAYLAGACYRYLVKLSKSDELQIEPIINAGTIQDVKMVLSNKFEQYQHEIKKAYLTNFGNITAVVLSYENEKKDFEDLKPYFYAGFVDNYANDMFMR